MNDNLLSTAYNDFEQQVHYFCIATDDSIQVYRFRNCYFVGYSAGLLAAGLKRDLTY